MAEAERIAKMLETWKRAPTSSPQEATLERELLNIREEAVNRNDWEVLAEFEKRGLVQKFLTKSEERVTRMLEAWQKAPAASQQEATLERELLNIREEAVNRNDWEVLEEFKDRGLTRKFISVPPAKRKKRRYG